MKKLAAIIGILATPVAFAASPGGALVATSSQPCIVAMSGAISCQQQAASTPWLLIAVVVAAGIGIYFWQKYRK